MIRVALDDGSFRDFPDGTPEADILGALKAAPLPPPPAPSLASEAGRLLGLTQPLASLFAPAVARAAAAVLPEMPAPTPLVRAGDLIQQFGESAAAAVGTAVPNALSYLTSFGPASVQQSGDEFARGYQEYYQPTLQKPGVLDALARSAGSAIGSLAPTLAALPLGVPGFVGSAFLPTAGSERLEALDAGAPESRAKAQGAVAGLLEVLTEKFGGNIGKVTGVNQLAKVGTRDLLTEPLEEVLSTVGSDLSAAYLTQTDPSRAQGIPGRALESAFGGLVGAAALGPAQAQSRNETRRQLQDAEQALVQRLTQNPADIEAAAQLKRVNLGLAQLATEDELPAKDPVEIARKVGFRDGDVEFVALPKGTVSGRNYVTEAPPTPDELRALRVSGVRSVNGTSIEDMAPVHAWANLNTGKVTVFNPNLSAARLERELREEWTHLVLNRTEQGRAALKEFFDARPLTAPELDQLKAYTQRPDEADDQYRLRLTDEFLAKLNKDTSWWRPRVQEFVALAKKTFGFNLTNAQAGRLVLRNLRRQGVTAYGQVQGQGSRQDEVAGLGAGSATAQPRMRESVAREPKYAVPNDLVLPPVPAGHTRFYHGGVPGEGPRWVSPLYDYAKGYASKSGGVVQYVDVPNTHPGLRRSYEDEGLPVRAPFSAWEAPDEVMRTARVISPGSAGSATAQPRMRESRVRYSTHKTRLGAELVAATDSGAIALEVRIYPDEVDGTPMASVAPELRGQDIRGQGIGTKLYLGALRFAKDRGVGFLSDSILSDKSARMYERLAQFGVPFVRAGQQFRLPAEELAGVDLAEVERRAQKFYAARANSGTRESLAEELDQAVTDAVHRTPFYYAYSLIHPAFGTLRYFESSGARAKQVASNVRDGGELKTIGDLIYEVAGLKGGQTGGRATYRKESGVAGAVMPRKVALVFEPEGYTLDEMDELAAFKQGYQNGSDAVLILPEKDLPGGGVEYDTQEQEDEAHQKRLEYVRDSLRANRLPATEWRLITLDTVGDTQRVKFASADDVLDAERSGRISKERRDELLSGLSVRESLNSDDLSGRVFYHGTRSSRFDRFSADAAAARSQTDLPSGMVAMTSNPAVAKTYARGRYGHVREVSIAPGAKVLRLDPAYTSNQSWRQIWIPNTWLKANLKVNAATEAALGREWHRDERPGQETMVSVNELARAAAASGYDAVLVPSIGDVSAPPPRMVERRGEKIAQVAPVSQAVGDTVIVFDPARVVFKDAVRPAIRTEDGTVIPAASPALAAEHAPLGQAVEEGTVDARGQFRVRESLAPDIVDKRDRAARVLFGLPYDGLFVGQRGDVDRLVASYVDQTPAGDASARTRTPEFKAWFGDWEDPDAFSSRRKGQPVSVVVGRDGAPLRAYHSTRGDFTKFETGRDTANNYGFFGNVPTTRAAVFFSDEPQQAESYSYKDPSGKFETGAKTLPVYLRMTSPIRFDDSGLDYEALAKELEVSYRWIRQAIPWELFDGKRGREFVEKAKAAGYDGAVFREDAVAEGVKTGTTYAVFDPEQIKSAIGNTGAYDPTKSDIRESLADFSQSKVRNPDGSLMVRYHGTAGEEALDKGITIFKADRREPGPHFGSRDQAEQFTRDPDLKRRGQIYPVYLDIRNPLRTPDMWPLSSGLPLSMRWRTLDALQDMVPDRQALVQLEMALEGLHDGPSLRDALLKLGYDGIVYDNVREGGGDSWIAFRPESQVKSAIGNTGAFDVTKPDIRESLGDSEQTRLWRAMGEAASEQRGPAEMLGVMADTEFRPLLELARPVQQIFEHAGDLINRLGAHDGPQALKGMIANGPSDYGREAALNKIGKVLRWLGEVDPGIDATLRPYVERTLAYAQTPDGAWLQSPEWPKTVGEAVLKLKAWRRAYATEHAKLRPATQAQELAQRAAVSIGRDDLGQAKRSLTELQRRLQGENWRRVYYTPSSVFESGFNPATPDIRESISEVPLAEFQYGDANDASLYHVTTRDGWSKIQKTGELRVGRGTGTFSGAAARSNSEGRLFFTERSGVRFWADRVAEQIEAAVDLGDDENAEDRVVVLRVPREKVPAPSQDTAEMSGRGRDYFTTSPVKVRESLSEVDEERYREAVARGEMVGPLFHGTDREFDKFKPGRASRNEMFPFGVHLAESPEFAGQYGNRVVRAYLSHGKILDTDQVVERSSELGQWLDSIARGSVWFPEGSRQVAYLRNALEAVPDKRLQKELEAAGYDTLRYVAEISQIEPQGRRPVAKSVSYVVLRDPSRIRQVKSATGNRDIRESLAEFSQGSMFVTPDGQLQTWYHATDQAGFTEFDPERRHSGLTPATYFTDMPEMSMSYAAGEEAHPTSLAWPSLPMGRRDAERVADNLLGQTGNVRTAEFGRAEIVATRQRDTGWIISQTGEEEEDSIELTREAVTDWLLRVVAPRVSVEPHSAMYRVVISLRPDEVYQVDWQGKPWDRSMETVVAQGKQAGFKATLVRNVRDYGNNPRGDRMSSGNVLAVYNPAGRVKEVGAASFDLTKPDIRESISEVDTNTLAHQLGIQIVLGDQTVAEPGKVTVDRNTARGDLRDTVILAQAEANILQLPPRFVDEVLAPYARQLDPQAGTDIKAWFTARAQNWQKRSLLRKTLDWWRFKLPTNRVRLEKAFGRLLDTVLSDPEFKVQYDPASPRQAFANQNADVLPTLRPIIRELRARAGKVDEYKKWEADADKARQTLEKARDDFFARGGSAEGVPSPGDDQFLFALGRDGDAQLAQAHAWFQYASKVESTARKLEELAKLGQEWATFNEAQARPQAVGAAAAEAAISFRNELTNRQQKLVAKIDWDFAPAARRLLALEEAQIDARAAAAVLFSNEDVATWAEMVDMATSEEDGADLTPNPDAIPQTSRDNAVIDFFARKQALRDVSEEEQIRLGDKVRAKLAELKAALKEKGLRRAEKEFAADAFIKTAMGETGHSGTIADREEANDIRRLSAQAAEFAVRWAESGATTTTVEELVQELAGGQVPEWFNLSPGVLQEILGLLRRSPRFRNALVALRDAASAKFRNDPLTIIENLEQAPEEDRPAILGSALRRIQRSLRMYADSMVELRSQIRELELELARLDTVSSLFPSSPEILETLRERRNALRDKQDVSAIEARLVAQRNLRDLNEDSRTAVARMVYPSHDGWVFKDPMGGPDLVISPTKQFSKATLAQVQDWLANVERFWPVVPEHIRKGLVVGSRVASIFLHENFTSEELRRSLIPSSLLEGFSKLPISFKAIYPTLVPGLWGGLLQDRLRALEDAQSAKNGIEARWMEPLHQAMIRAAESLELDRANIDHVRQFNALRNETLHRLRIFGSGVEVGDMLWSVPGKTITPELLALARLDHRIGRDARAVDARRPYAGIRLETRRGQLVRPSGETGDVGVARLANADTLRIFVDAYRNPDPVYRQAWWSTADAQNGLRFHFFDADRTDTLIKRDGTRDREIELKRKIIRGEVRLSDLNTVEDWARASGIPVPDLMAELEQYFDLAKARLGEQSRDPITSTGVFDSQTDHTEFTSPAAKLSFPSSWYDYGATRGLKSFLNRTVSTAEVEYLQAMIDARDHLRLLAQRITRGESTVEEMQWVLGTDRTEFTDADRKKAASAVSSREAFLEAQRQATRRSRVRPPMDGFLRLLHRVGIAPMLATTGAWAQQIVSSGVTSYLSLVPLVGPVAAGLLTSFNMGAAVLHAFVDLSAELGRSFAPSYVPPAETDAFLLANGIGVTYRKQYEAEREAMERGEGGSSKLGIAATRFGAAWDEGVRTLNRVLGTVRGDVQNNRFAVRVLVPQMILALKYATALSPAAKEYLAGLGVGNAEEVFQQLKSMPIRRFWATEAGRALALKVVRDYNAVSVGNRPDAGPYFTLLGWPSYVLGSVIRSARRTPEQSRVQYLKPLVAVASVAILSDIVRLEALDWSKEATRNAAQRVLEALPDDDDDEEGWWETLVSLLGLYRLLRAVAGAQASAPPLQPWDPGYFERPLLEVVTGLAKNAVGGIGLNAGGVSLPILSIGSNAVSGVVQIGRGLVDTGITDVKGGARKTLGMAGLYGRILGEFLFPGGRAGFEANAELVGLAHQEGIPIATRAFDPGFLSATPYRREMLALGERLAAGDETALPALEDVRKRVEDRARSRALRQGKTEAEADDAAEQAVRSMVTSLDPYRSAVGRALTEQEYDKLRARASDRVRKTERARDAVVKGLKLRPTRGMMSPLRKRKALGKPRRVRL